MQLPADFLLRDLQHARAVARVIAPVERGMRVEDLQPASEQDQQAQHIDPVHDAHRQSMAIDQLGLGGSLGRHGTSGGTAMAVSLCAMPFSYKRRLPRVALI